MSTTTQFNPNVDLNKRLIAAGLSKTVYALVTPETRSTKALLFKEAREMYGVPGGYFDMFEEAWTGKQDSYHRTFFDTWTKWSEPVVDFDRALFPFSYPTAGASEPLRHLIFDLKARNSRAKIHIFRGEYEGYKAMAEAAGVKVVEYDRDNWITKGRTINRAGWNIMGKDDLFFISQPSAIDGNVWSDFNEFIETMPEESVVADITYVGAIPQSSVPRRFNLRADSIRNIVFSLSKPFGVYYDRIGGVFSREEDAGLFGNQWFKNLTSLALGTKLLENYPVFKLPHTYAEMQARQTASASDFLGIALRPSDVFILANGAPEGDQQLISYLTRADRVRICLTPGLAAAIREANT